MFHDWYISNLDDSVNNQATNMPSSGVAANAYNSTTIQVVNDHTVNDHRDTDLGTGLTPAGDFYG